MAGFSLLETLVAVALIATTGLALLAWLNQSLDAATRLVERQRTQTVLREASHFIEGLNPTETPAGELDLGSVHFEWSTEPRTASVPNISPATREMGDFELALYEVTLRATGADLPAPVVLRQLQIGWKRVRESAASGI